MRGLCKCFFKWRVNKGSAPRCANTRPSRGNKILICVPINVVHSVQYVHYKMFNNLLYLSVVHYTVYLFYVSIVHFIAQMILNSCSFAQYSCAVCITKMCIKSASTKISISPLTIMLKTSGFFIFHVFVKRIPTWEKKNIQFLKPFYRYVGLN